MITHSVSGSFAIRVSGVRWVAVSVCALAIAGSQGVPPRSNPADYPVSGVASNTGIGAVIIPPDVVRKMFSNEIARNYTVVEVAIYPQDGKSFDANRYDFALQTGDKIAQADAAPDVVLPWDERKNPLDSKVNVTQEAGVYVGHTNDPYYGKRTSVATYEGTTVSNGPPPALAAPSGPDPRIVEARLRDKALPEGRTAQAVAGYLYFPQYYKKHKGDSIELQYSKQDVEVNLKFPSK